MSGDRAATIIGLALCAGVGFILGVLALALVVVLLHH